MQTFKLKYLKLKADTEIVERETGAYLFDMCVDAENCGVKQAHHDGEDEVFWEAMYNAARCAVQMRSEDSGVAYDRLLDDGRKI